MIRTTQYTILLLLALVLGACSTTSIDGDGPGKQIDAASVENAVPRNESPSKYGNMSSYVVNGVRYAVMKSSDGYVAQGRASWYGKKFHGRRTSSGEVFNMYLATAAHRSLPLPTYAVVTNLDNGKKVLVKINDRGPFYADRIIDLSYAAAVKIGIAEAGTGRVEVHAINSGSPSSSSAMATTVAIPLVSEGTYVQIGAFKYFVNAQEMRARALGAGILGVSVDQGKSNSGEKLYLVRAGPFAKMTKIESIIGKLQKAGITDFKLVGGN